MELVTPIKPIEVKISQKFTWDEFIDSYRKFWEKFDEMIKDYPRKRSDENEPGFICIINSVYCEDILSWKNLPYENISFKNKGNMFEFVSFPNLKIKVYLNNNVPKNQVNWEFHFFGSL